LHEAAERSRKGQEKSWVDMRRSNSPLCVTRRFPGPLVDRSMVYKWIGERRPDVAAVFGAESRD